MSGVFKLKLKGYEIPGMMRERGAHKWTQRSIDFSDDILGNTKEYKYQQKYFRPACWTPKPQALQENSE